MKVGILTGGGDCSGLNAVLRAFVLHGMEHHGFEVLGFLNGWKGLIEGTYRTLTPSDVREIIHMGGTILHTSRTNPYKVDGGVERVREVWRETGIDALAAIGGDDTLGVANKLNQEGLAIVGVPKTIDNDLSATDYTFGFDSAVNVAMESIDRLRTTAASHHRTFVVEVMGRYAGWIAAYAGVAGGAHVTLLPEFPIQPESVCRVVKNRLESGLGYSLVVVAEGAKRPDIESGELSTISEEKDAFGHVQLGGIGEWLAQVIEKNTGAETRTVVLGHVQRGGSPTAFDRVLGSRFGYAAAELVARKEFGKMVALKGTDIVAVPIGEGVSKLKLVGPELFQFVQALEN